MTLLHEFKREERYPSYFVNRLQDFISASRTDLRLTRKNNTEVEVAPAEPYGIAAIDLQGLWRFRETAVARAHPGGGAGTYVVWAVGTKQKIVEVPKPFTDETDYKFDLRITAGPNPEGAGVEVFEKIGEIDWDGAKITALRQTYNAVSGQMIQDGALSSEAAAGSDITWTREPNGAWVPALKANSVGSAELADLSVDTLALINLAVTEAKIAAEAITSSKLGVSAVTEEKIAALAVTTAKLALLSVTEAQLGAESVVTSKVKLLAITSALLAAEAVTEGKIANLAVTAGKLGPEAVETAKIKLLAVTAATIANEAIETGKIKNLAVTAAKLAAEAVETGKIQNLAVTAGKLAASAVTEEKIADGAVSSRKFKPTTGIKQGTGAEGTISGVGATRIEPGILFNLGYAAKLYCVVTGFWKEEGAAAGTQIGVASYEVGKFSVKSEAKAPGEAVGEGGNYFETVGTFGTGWHFVTASVVLELANAEREVFMAIWPKTVGGGNTTKYLPKAWCIQWMAVKS